MAPRRELAALKARLQRKARARPKPTGRASRQVVTGDGNLVAGGDLVIVHRDVKPDNRDGGQGLRSGGKIGISSRSGLEYANPPPLPVDPDASTWARLGYLVRLLLWRAAERLRGTTPPRPR